MSVSSDSEETVSEWEEDSERVPLQDVVEQETATDSEDSDNKKSQLLSRVKNNWRRVSTLACLVMASVLIGAAFSNIAPFLPREVKKKGFGAVVTGVIIGCAPLMVVIFSPIFGYLVPYLGLRSMVSLGLVLIGGSYLLLGFADLLPPNWIFVVYMASLRLCEGIGSALFTTAAFVAVASLFPKSVATVTGFVEVSIAMGLSVGFVIGGFLYEFGGFRLPFLSLGVLLLMLTLPCTLLVKEKSGTTKEETASLKLVFSFFSDPITILLVEVFIVVTSSSSFLLPLLQPFLWEEFQLNPVKTGLAFMIVTATYLASVLIIGPLSDLLGHRLFIIFGLLLCSVGFLFVGPAKFIAKPRLWLTCIGLVILGLAGALGAVPVYADLVAIARKKVRGGDEKEIAALTSVVSGVMSASLSLGGFLGPLVGGGLGEGLSFPTNSLIYGEVFLAQASMLAGVTLIERYTRPTSKPSNS